ncbi:MAG: ArnT family glycosyltransferase, partial [Flammeovirgaceae bacterium]
LMVGVVGDIFSLHHMVNNDFFLRFGPICLSAISIWLIYRIGVKVKSERAGLFAAYLYLGSIYCFIIAGFSFIPDSPLILFWLLALDVMIDFLPKQPIDSASRKKILLFGLHAGLAMLSKYQGAFLWVGVFLYVLFYNRDWLKEISFYLSGIISAILLLPILIWNIQNNFISFNYHSGRVTPTWEFRPDYFLTEVLGQFAYNSPVVYVLIVIALIALFRKKDFIAPSYSRILLSLATPLWLVFTSFSLFRSTLPHWSAPAFVSLIVLAAAYWSSHENQAKALYWMKVAPIFLGILLVIAVWLINYSPLQLGKKSELINFGEDDFTQDMYGWSQVEESFRKVSIREEKEGRMAANSDIISHRMFPGAHLDFYVGQANSRKVFAIGTLDDIHMYAWWNSKRGGLEKGKDYYHVALSNFYRDPKQLFENYFDAIEPMDTVAITRAEKPMRYVLFYRLRNYRGNFVDPLPSRR